MSNRRPSLTHLQEVVRRHAEDILTRDATRHLMDELKKTSPAVVDELIPGVMKLGEVQNVLQMLLREEVSIRQLSLILETLGDYASRTSDPIWLTEYVRNRLSRTICTRYRDEENRLHVITLDPALEDRISAGIEHNERGLFVRLAPNVVQEICDRISAETVTLPSRTDACRFGESADQTWLEADDGVNSATFGGHELQRSHS